VTSAADALARERYARVQAAMARRGVGALLLASPQLGTLASGARRVQIAGSGGSVPWVGIAAGAPAPLVFTPDPDGAPGWMPRDAVLPLRWDRSVQLARLATFVAGAPGALACDVFSSEVEALAAAAGRALVDAAPILADACAPKTEAEVERIATALAATRAGLRAALAALAPGVTPAALLARVAASMPVARAGFPLSEGLVWRAAERLVRQPATAPFAGGDRVAIEVGLYVGGVAGVAGDTADIDGGDGGARRRRWREVTAELGSCCRAGSATGALRAAAAAAGVTEAGLLAHGLGTGIEPPHVRLSAADDVPLGAGTVLVLAPVVEGFRATRALVVLPGAPRWLEDAP
jgi:hypothetical protein